MYSSVYIVTANLIIEYML